MLRSELLKLSTTRTFVALVAVAAALALVVTVLTASLSDIQSEDDARQFATSDMAQPIILILGVVGMAGEWRHKTIAGTILAAPDRVRLVLTKIVAYALAGVALSLVVNVLSMAVATIILSARDLPTLDAGGLADLLWRNLVLAAISGAIGVGIGGIIRNQTVAVVVVLTAFSLEPTLVTLVPEVGKFAPFIAAPTAFQETEYFGNEDAELLGPAVGVLVMIAWAAALCAAATVLLNRRDLSE